MIPRLAGRRAGDWIDQRLRLSKVTRHTVAKVFPDHWSFMMGEVALYSFVVLLATGTFLALFFEPTTAERLYSGSYQPLAGATTSGAYASTVELSFDIQGGLLIRQVHHWAALLFVAAIVVHLIRIFLTAAFRHPRELNWVVGVTMLLLAILNGFTGYSLPDDLLSGTGLRIASAVLLSIPLIGPWLQFLLLGGEFPGEATEQRLFVAHVLLVPALLTGLVVIHMAVLIRQKHAQFPGPGRRNTNVVGSRMWPTYAFRSLALLTGVAAVLVALGGLVQINPVWLWGPFDPNLATSPAQPDWYVGWLDGALRLFPPWEFRIAGHLVPSVFWAGVVMPAVGFTVLYAWPWVDRLITGDRAEHHLLERPRERPFRMAVLVGVLTFVGMLLLAASEDLAARVWRLPVRDVIVTMRFATLVLPPVAAAVAYFATRALLRSGAPSFAEMPVGHQEPGGEAPEGTHDQRAATGWPVEQPEEPELRRPPLSVGSTGGHDE